MFINEFFNFINARTWFWRLFLFTVVFFPCCGAAGVCARPVSENTRTLEVRLKYKVINEIKTASDLDRYENASGAAAGESSGAFSVLRNDNQVKDACIIGGTVLAAGSFGVMRLKSGGFSENSTDAIKSIKGALECLAGNGCFGAVINCVEFDGQTLYLGTSGGDVIEAAGESARMISIIRSKGRYSIKKLRKSGDVLFILTDGGGLYTYSKNRIYCVSTLSHGILSDSLNDMDIFDGGNGLYAVLASQAGVSILKINDTSKNDFDAARNIRTKTPAETTIYRGGRIYYGGAFGLASLPAGNMADYSPDTELADIYVTSICAGTGGAGDAKTDITFATYLSGVYRLSGPGAGAVKTITAGDLEAANKSRAQLKKIKTAGGGLLMVHENGIFEYSNNTLRGLYSSGETFSDRISALCEYRDMLFCGTFNAGIFVKTKDRVTDFGSICARRLSGLHVNALAVFNGKLLIGTSNGLDIYDFDARNFSRTAAELHIPAVNCFHVANGKAFIGTSDGIATLDENFNVNKIKLNPDSIDRHVYSLHYHAPSNTLYFGTYRGMGAMKPGDMSPKTYLMINSAIPDNWVTLVRPYKELLLIGTYDKGICLFDPAEKKFLPAPGRGLLPSKMVNANAFFSSGNFILIGTYNGGVAVIDAGGKKWRARHFNQRAGLSGDMATSMAGFENSIYIGTFSGMSAIDAKSLPSLFERP